jgi:hypothetical protein
MKLVRWAIYIISTSNYFLEIICFKQIDKAAIYLSEDFERTLKSVILTIHCLCNAYMINKMIDVNILTFLKD